VTPCVAFVSPDVFARLMRHFDSSDCHVKSTHKLRDQHWLPRPFIDEENFFATMLLKFFELELETGSSALPHDFPCQKRAANQPGTRIYDFGVKCNLIFFFCCFVFGCLTVFCSVNLKLHYSSISFLLSRLTLCLTS
jgi:hypothetical protein